MGYEVTVKHVDPERLASVRGIFRIADLQSVVGNELCRIMGAVAAQGAKPAGVVSVYHGWTDETVDTELGLTIEGDFVAQEDIKPSGLPGGEVAFTTHVGRYERIGEAYGAIQEYAEKNGLKLADMMWERYLTDPAVEPDLDKHVTEVFWPLA